jgi:hypothetical protein
MRKNNISFDSLLKSEVKRFFSMVANIKAANKDSHFTYSIDVKCDGYKLFLPKCEASASIVLNTVNVNEEITNQVDAALRSQSWKIRNIEWLGKIDLCPACFQSGVERGVISGDKAENASPINRAG